MDVTGPTATPEAMLPGSRSNHLPSPSASDLSLPPNKTVRLSFSVDAIMSSDRYNKPERESHSTTSSLSPPLRVVSPESDDHRDSYHHPPYSPDARRCDSRGSSEDEDPDIDPVSDDDIPHNDSFGSSDRSSPASSSQDHPHQPLAQRPMGYAVHEFLHKSRGFPGSPRGGVPGVPGAGPGAHPFLVSPDTGARWHPAATSPADLSWFSAAAASIPPPLPSKFSSEIQNILDFL